MTEKNIEARYKSRRWEKLRDKALKRDKYLCQICRRYGTKTDATIVHHLKHADEYPELFWKLDNLQSVCQSCHNKLHPEKGKSPPHGGYGTGI